MSLFIPPLTLLLPRHHSRSQYHTSRLPIRLTLGTPYPQGRKSNYKLTENELAFIDWCSNVGIVAPKVKIGYGVNGQRGLIAVDDIPSGEVLVTVPREAALVVETDVNVGGHVERSRGGHICRSNGGSSGIGGFTGGRNRAEGFVSAGFWRSVDWEVRLAVLLLKEALGFSGNGETADGAFDFGGYVGVLPRSGYGLGCVVHCGDGDQGESRSVAGLEEVGLEEVGECYRWKVRSLYERLKSALVPAWRERVQLEDWLWAVGAVQSRAFGVPPQALNAVGARTASVESHWGGSGWSERRFSPRAFALVPMMDMMNHSVHVKTKFWLDEETQAFKIKTDCSFAAGEEVLISYGNHSNDDLLLFYGFVEASNPADVVWIDDVTEWIFKEVSVLREWSSGDNGHYHSNGIYNASIESLWEEKLALLRDWNLSYEGKRYSLRRDCIDDELIVALRILLATKQELQSMHENIKSVSSSITSAPDISLIAKKSLSLENEVAMWQAISNKCSSLLRKLKYDGLEATDRFSRIADGNDTSVGSLLWDWSDGGGAAQNLYRAEKMQVLQMTIDKVEHFRRTSLKVGRITTVLLPPNQSLLTTRHFDDVSQATSGMLTFDLHSEDGAKGES